jgi:TATA-binding protein-associated factor
LQYLRKLCNHPALILTPEHPKWLNVQNELKESQMSLNDIRLSGKLLALKSVLMKLRNLKTKSFLLGNY